MQLNAIQTQLNTSQEREPWRGRSASEASPFSVKESVGICWNVLGSSGVVPKLLNSKARFPFFVRQVFIFCLECVHICKVSHPKGPQNGPHSGSLQSWGQVLCQMLVIRVRVACKLAWSSAWSSSIQLNEVQWSSIKLFNSLKLNNETQRS